MFDPAVGTAERGQGLLVSLAVAHEVKGDERVVNDVPESVGPRNVERVCVMKDRLVCAVRFFQPPVVGDGVGAVIVVSEAPAVSLNYKNNLFGIYFSLDLFLIFVFARNSSGSLASRSWLRARMYVPALQPPHSLVLPGVELL